MPKLEKITIQNWRNIELQELSFSAEMNCVCGNNGEGKTNLLDAIYYLSMSKSAFGPSDKYNFLMHLHMLFLLLYLPMNGMLLCIAFHLDLKHL